MASRRYFLAQCSAFSLTLAAGPWARLTAAPPERKQEDSEKLITPETRKAIDKGLKYLMKGQHDKGSFGVGAYHGNVAVTGLAGLAFVAAGAGADSGDRGKVVSKALEFVLSQEDRDGTHPGYLHNPQGSPHGPMYGHGFGTLFLAYLEGKIKDRKLRGQRQKVLEKAVELIVKSQNTEGGWRYLPQSQDADISVTACQIMALTAAHAAGFKVPKKTADAATSYVKKCQDGTTGGYRYMQRGGGAAGVQAFARTAAAVAVLQALGILKGAAVDKGLDFILSNRPPAPGGRPNMHYYYGHYYAAQALRRAGGDAWKKWYAVVRKELLAAQAEDGSWADQIDPHYATAMACLVLLAPESRLAAKAERKE